MHKTHGTYPVAFCRASGRTRRRIGANTEQWLQTTFGHRVFGTRHSFCLWLGIFVMTTVVSCTRQGPESPNGNGTGGNRPDAAMMPNEFEQALQQYKGIVKLLGTEPPIEQDEAIQRALTYLTSAVEHMPTPADPARSEAVKLLKSNDFDIWIAFQRGPVPASQVRESLRLTASVLILTARQLSPAAPPFERAVAEFERAVGAINPSASLSAEQPEIVRALQQGLAALEAIPSSSRAIADAGTG